MPFLQTRTKRLHYRDTPPAEGSTASNKTLILIHGLGSSQNYYTAVTPTLAAAGHRCISLDTTGQGRSPYTGIEQSVDSLAGDIVDAMDALGVATAYVAGHSMAGITVPHLAATKAPERVAGVVLLGPVLPSKEAGPTFEARIAAVEQKGMEAMGDTVPYAAVGSAAGPLQHAFIREILMAQDPAGYVSMCRVIVGAAATVPAYEKVKVPALIIAGEEDKSAPLKGCEHIRDSLGGPKEMVVLQKIGHWMCVEDPVRVGTEMNKWLSSLK